MFEPGTHISLTWVSLIPEKKVVYNAKVTKVKRLFLTLFVKTLTTYIVLGIEFLEKIPLPVCQKSYFG